MLDLVLDRKTRGCDGIRRRDMLRIGTLGAGMLGLPQLLAAREAARDRGERTKDTSVVWLWLGGGPTHVETFDPKMTAPAEYRSVTGEQQTNVAGVTVGGTFPGIASVADRMAFVRSFAHTNSGHGGGTHYVMTGYDNRTIDNGGLPTRPAMGSILAKVRGPNHETSGIPTYVRLGGINSDGPAFLGSTYGPFDPKGQARKNMTLSLDRDRLTDRRGLLQQLGHVGRVAESVQATHGLDRFDEQAFDLILGNAPEAFSVEKEPKAVRERYGKGLGEQMLLARKLCEAGCGFVTIQYGGWDMHNGIKAALEKRSPELDRAVAAFVADVYERSLNEKILLVISGEFGRTPRINTRGGRDHWAPLSTLALAGGGLRMGQAVGQSASKVDVPHSRPIRPQDLMATVFHVLGLSNQLQFVNQQGRPVYMVENGRPIPELV